MQGPGGKVLERESQKGVAFILYLNLKDVSRNIAAHP